MKKQLSSGFTLIELLVVVLIIGILSSIALPQYTKAVEKARASEATMMLGNIRKALDALCLADPSFSGEVVHCSSSPDYKCNVLDIDIESALTCDATSCHSKYFVYDVMPDCYNKAHEVRLYRYNNGNKAETMQYDVQMDTYSGGKWKFSCEDYNTNYPYAKTVCESFERLL